MSKRSLTYVAFSLLIFFALLWLSSCAHRLQLVEGGRYSDPQGYFELSIPENGWQLLSWKDVDFALWDEDEGATIVIQVTPLKENLELAILTNDLLIAFDSKRIISRDMEKIDEREALKTVLEAWTERTEITVEAYVVRGKGVSYDIIFWAPRDVFPHKVEAFHQLLAGITLLKP
jgi:hypothetical protein